MRNQILEFHLMHKDFAELMLAMYPNAITYVDGQYVVIGEFPRGFEGTVLRVADEELTNAELLAKVDDLIAAVPTGLLVIFSETQGDYILANHPKFKQVIIDEAV